MRKLLLTMTAVAPYPRKIHIKQTPVTGRIHPQGFAGGPFEGCGASPIEAYERRAIADGLQRCRASLTEL